MAEVSDWQSAVVGVSQSDLEKTFSEPIPLSLSSFPSPPAALCLSVHAAFVESTAAFPPPPFSTHPKSSSIFGLGKGGNCGAHIYHRGDSLRDVRDAFSFYFSTSTPPLRTNKTTLSRTFLECCPNKGGGEKSDTERAVAPPKLKPANTTTRDFPQGAKKQYLLTHPSLSPSSSFSFPLSLPSDFPHHFSAVRRGGKEEKEEEGGAVEPLPLPRWSPIQLPYPTALPLPPSPLGKAGMKQC